MVGIATALTGFAGLEVRRSEEDWVILIRRADFTADPVFATFHGKELNAQDIARLLPHCASLQWAQVPANMLSTSESCAQDGQYQVSLRAAPGSSKLHIEAIDAFRRFMAQR